jgi:hypothetical protein
MRMSRLLSSQVSWVLASTLLGVLLVGAGTAVASPIVSIGEGQTHSWADALAGTAGGTLQTATSLTDLEQSFYTGEVGAGNFGLATPIALEAVNPVVIDGEGHDSLVMSWNPWPGSDEPNDLSIAAWEYVYDADPDLTGFDAHFSIGVPPDSFGQPAIWDVSFELIDNMGRTRGWFWPMPSVGWSTQWLDLDNPVPQGPFSVFGETPGFDITNVVAIRLDEAGMFATFPPQPGSSTLWDWNAWNSLAIVPEPNSISLAAFGFVALAAYGWRRMRV